MKKDFSSLVEKIQSLKDSGDYDLSMEEDLSIAVMNLISLEEHFFFTGKKTSKPEYFDLIVQTREIRKELLARLVNKHEGETWCASKHLLAATMRLIEVGTKLQAGGKKQQAQKTFDQAYKTFSLFWGVRLKLIDVPTRAKPEKNKPMTYESIMEELVDCCDE
jgi:hypothetical protein